MTELRKGQKVRVTFEAEYLDELETFAHRATRQIGENTHYYRIPADATIEPIEDLRPGDIYRENESGDVYARAMGYEGWRLINCHCGRRVPHNSDPLGPLTLLVRDGQVQP
jgi:hypothetical protein